MLGNTYLPGQFHLGDLKTSYIKEASERGVQVRVGEGSDNSRVWDTPNWHHFRNSTTVVPAMLLRHHWSSGTRGISGWNLPPTRLACYWSWLNLSFNDFKKRIVMPTLKSDEEPYRSWKNTMHHIVKKVKSLSRVQLFATPWTVAHQALCPWDSPGKNTGVGCHFLLQGIFPTQGSKPGLPHCRQVL